MMMVAWLWQEGRLVTRMSCSGSSGLVEDSPMLLLGAHSARIGVLRKADFSPGTDWLSPDGPWVLAEAVPPR